ncbi:MAG: hypothetical protein QOK17_2201 [Sphingomonadales bacterium]|jgi:hypothetical protein|nr:hypothetical protein [Sphingomonadales bacterium]
MADTHDRETEHLTVAAKTMEAHRTGLVLTGRIKNGKLVLDRATEREIATKFAKADQAFIAMNSPFDPQSQSIQ